MRNQDEANRARHALLVDSDAVEHLRGKPVFHVHRQPEARQQRCHARQQPGSVTLRAVPKASANDHPERHRLAVQKLETGRGSLSRDQPCGRS